MPFTRVSSLAAPIALSLAVLLSGCSGIARPMRDAIAPPGELDADGTINPCHGYRTDHQACGNAIFNAARIGKVDIGNSMAQVRATMGHDAELKNIEVRDGRKLESWNYLTEYDKGITTRIEFTDGAVVGIKQLINAD